MRVAVLDTYYAPFLREHYAAAPELARASYGEQHEALMGRSFSTSDSYSYYLRELGHEAAEFIVNCVPVQARWMAEHGFRTTAGGLRPLFERGGHVAARLIGALHRITLAQIEAFSPDVVYMQDIAFHTTRQVRELRGRRRLVVGQIASKAPAADHLRAFDLITTSFPHFVERLRTLGVSSEYFRLGFDERVLDRLPGPPSLTQDIVFVGGLDPRVHGEGVLLLERLCAEFGDTVAVYGYGASRLPKGSSIAARYRGEAWGLDMYRVLAGARVAFNRHIAAAEGYANNMRLYEATGVGAALLTDKGTNLSDLFKPGREVATYSDADELIARARDLLEHESRRAAVASAGQARTLAEHTYAHRMVELVSLLEDHLARRRRPPAYTP
jgi:spore maturation protein CgeB